MVVSRYFTIELISNLKLSQGTWDKEKWTNDAASNGHGWVGSFGPFWPVTTNEFGTYYTIYSKKEEKAESDLHPFGVG